jgi:hypothetical protein
MMRENSRLTFAPWILRGEAIISAAVFSNGCVLAVPFSRDEESVGTPAFG